MASSQECPVCGRFSSSSNTTLNAHIDQCLSLVPKTKLQASFSRGVKHQIKPRRMRSMADIYETARSSTLQDQRNRTNRASNWKLHFEDDSKGGVYFDSNGMKLRILSKLGDLPSSSKEDHVLDDHLMKTDDLGLIKKWVVSKRTVRKKRTERVESMREQSVLLEEDQKTSPDSFSLSKNPLFSWNGSVTGSMDSKFRKKRSAPENAEKNHNNSCSVGVVASGFFGITGPSNAKYDDDALEALPTSYTGVAPIMIPGPPGCVLPSPGIEGSEELQANSSLTRMQSSNDEHEGVGIESPDSPISTIQHPNQADVSETRVVEAVARTVQEINKDLDGCHSYPSFEDYSFGSISRSFEPKPPASNPVLRLMGKNLMVVNKDDHPSPRSGTGSMTATSPSARNNPASFIKNVENNNTVPFFTALPFSDATAFIRPRDCGPGGSRILYPNASLLPIVQWRPLYN